MQRLLKRAPIVYNGLGTARRDGAVLVQEALGRWTVVAVGDADELIAAYPQVEVVDSPFALSPAPVNSHTHLDLSSMPYTAVRYEEFIPAVIAHSRSGRRSLEATEAGVSELLASGTEVVGDIVTNDEAMRYLLAHPRLRGVAYWEVLAPDPKDAERVLAETREALMRFLELQRPNGMRVGLSPHTPHTVSGPLLQGLAELARQLRLPMQIHVAESPDEVALHLDGSGPLARALADFHPNWSPSGLSPIGYLESLGVLSAAPTLVHMVHVSEADVALVQRNGCCVVHCPRSNEALGCGRFPWEAYARHGVTVALGTDSRGSSPSLSVEEEVHAALELHGDKAGAQSLVRAAVKGGHRALGLRPPRFLRGDDAGGLYSWRDVRQWVRG